jgi:uncharacterized membrane protein HdeD (DUF308 family)
MFLEETTMHDSLLNELGRNWGWIAFRGVAAVLFGLLALTLPGITLAALVIVWGGYALADGVLSLIAAFQARGSGSTFWSLFFSGLIGIAAGIATFLWPAITAIALLIVIACWALMIGIFQIVLAIRLRKVITHEWLLGMSGLLSLLFGVLMIVSPGTGALAMAGVIAGYSILFGVTLIALGFRLRSLGGGHAAMA